jgi:hypothetical protein
MKLLVKFVFAFSMFLFGCQGNKTLMLSNNNDLYDSVLINIEINGKIFFDKYISLNRVIPDFITMPITHYGDTLLIKVTLPEIGINSNAAAASKDFKFIYVSLFKEPDMQRIDSGLSKSPEAGRKQYFRSNISISFENKKISPLF